MIVAAGISYIFNGDQPPPKTQDETVTASSTIVDQQGILKYVIYPRMINPYSYLYRPLMKEEQRNVVSVIRKCQADGLEVPMEMNRQINDFKQEFAVVFFWSIPLKARLLQTPAKSSFMLGNLNPFEHHSMKISIGTQNEIHETIPSEIALSNSDDTLDSLASNPLINDQFMPAGILKKKKLDWCEGKRNEKRFCLDRELIGEKFVREMIVENVNLCVENLSKILSESCVNTEEQLTTLHNSSSLLSVMNNSNQSMNPKIRLHTDLKSFKPEEAFTSAQFYPNNANHDPVRLSDGVILHRGDQFGIALGDPMIPKFHTHENPSICSPHSINELNQLLSPTNCFFMRQYQIESIEDLIRVFLEQGEEQFTELMIHVFKVDPSIVEQLNLILLPWTKQLN